MGYRWPVRRKYNNRKTLTGFNSKLEGSVYQILQLREKSGEITDIRCQHSVVLGTEIVRNERTGKERKRTIRWKVDFSFVVVATCARVWAEAKGVETSLYRKQLRLWREGAGPGSLEIWKGNYRRPKLVEIVNP